MNKVTTMKYLLNTGNRSFSAMVKFAEQCDRDIANVEEKFKICDPLVKFKMKEQVDLIEGLQKQNRHYRA